jgi:hypothetical protein
MGSVAKSYMRKGLLLYEEMRKYLTIYEEAVSHICITLQPIPSEFDLFFIIVFILSFYSRKHRETPEELLCQIF